MIDDVMWTRTRRRCYRGKYLIVHLCTVVAIYFLPEQQQMKNTIIIIKRIDEGTDLEFDEFEVQISSLILDLNRTGPSWTRVFLDLYNIDSPERERRSTGLSEQRRGLDHTRSRFG